MAAAEIFSRSGYRGATTRRIAERARVNEVTLFRHFGSKAELIRAAIRSARLPLERSLPAAGPFDPRSDLIDWARGQLAGMHHARSMIRTCMGESEEHPEIMRVASERPTAVRSELVAYLGELQRRGLADPDVNMDAAASLFMGGLFMDAMGRDVMPEMFRYEADAVPSLYVDMMLRAIGARVPCDRAPGPDGGMVE